MVIPWGVTETVDGRVFAFGHPKGDFAASPIFEITKLKAKLVKTLTGVEGIFGLENRLLAAGASFEEGALMHVLDGTRWTTHKTGAGLHTLRTIGGRLTGVGRDGLVGQWNDKTSTWKILTKEVMAIQLTGATEYEGEIVVAGVRTGKACFGVVAGDKIKAIKVPTTSELRDVTTTADGRLVATGQGGTVLVGTPKAMKLVPPGKRTQSFGTVLEWEGRVLIAGRSDGILELSGDTLAVFSKAPGHRLAIAGGLLWRLDTADGLSYWKKDGWAAVKLST